MDAEGNYETKARPATKEEKKEYKEALEKYKKGVRGEEVEIIYKYCVHCDGVVDKVAELALHVLTEHQDKV